MPTGDLAAVVSFIGVVVQLGGELLLVLLFVLLRGYVVRRGYFAAWTAAWACGAVAIMAVCVRYFIMPQLSASPLDESSMAVQSLYLVYQTGKLASFALFVAGTAMYVTGSRLLGRRRLVIAATMLYAVASVIGARGNLNQLVVWQAPLAVVSLGAVMGGAEGAQLLEAHLAVAVGVDLVEVLGDARQGLRLVAADEPVAVGVGLLDALEHRALAVRAGAFRRGDGDHRDASERGGGEAEYVFHFRSVLSFGNQCRPGR